MTPTDEQLAAIDSTRRGTASLMLDALAGTGKTTTLAMLAKECRGPSLALAFNKAIAEEMRKRFPPAFDVKTLNGLGFGVLRREFPGVSKWNADPRKLGKIINTLGKTRRERLSTEDWDTTRRIVTAAQLAGIRPGVAGDDAITPDTPEVWENLALGIVDSESDIERLCELAYAALVESNCAIEHGEISFDDQVYWPVVFGAKFPRYGRVLVDEAQDLNRLNHSAVERVSAGGWLGVCGDPRQSIYGFRGSITDSMGRLRKTKTHWDDKLLTLTFRCPKEIVRRQWDHAPGYRAAEGNADGRVLDWTRRGWTWDDLWAEGNADALGMDANRRRPEIAILCRNNAPLLTLAFKLIRQRVAIRVAGRDIGKGLESLTKKLSPDLSTSTIDFLHRLREWGETERSLARANGHEERVDTIEDREECLVALCDPSVRTVRELLSLIEQLFAEGGATAMTLSSIHKAKGLEWHTVMHLDPWRVPSWWAKREGGEVLRQERNLKYVLETRTKATLIEATLEGFDRGKTT